MIREFAIVGDLVSYFDSMILALGHHVADTTIVVAATAVIDIVTIIVAVAVMQPFSLFQRVLLRSFMRLVCQQVVEGAFY